MRIASNKDEGIGSVAAGLGDAQGGLATDLAPQQRLQLAAPLGIASVTLIAEQLGPLGADQTRKLARLRSFAVYLFVQFAEIGLEDAQRSLQFVALLLEGGLLSESETIGRSSVGPPLR